MKPIDLTPKKREHDNYKEMSSPCSPYDGCPNVYLTGPAALSELPEEGTITFKFKRKEVSIRNDEGPPVSLILKLFEIVDAKDGKVEEPKKEEDSGAALDRLAKEVEDEEID